MHADSLYMHVHVSAHTGIRKTRSQAPPSFPLLLVRKSGRGPGIFSHVSDVRIERMVERV